ncbi:hypothetical protein ROJ8625_04101 [Roseivivax jejudonensis]|uniref:Portal protein n=1 Tax=Roseivivax jejudonensis TaxID=1529041 RepID=A0A1X7AB75_9RHOB|nr:hypothetical protein [Roseivivax jejudonensis]SLN74783.1 hypothetical protein ROJ8625_04101 [Roseivivax jejudonensis]
MQDDEQTDAPKASRPWLEAISEAEKAFNVWQEKSDNIAKLYAALTDMADFKGDREFKIFWANMEILRPSVYQRAPSPVVMPRHTDTGEVPRKAAELLERVLEYDVEADDLHETLLSARDDMCLAARGVVWVLDDGHAIHVDRHDFVHEPGRKWSEVGWVARRAYLTLEQGTKRFGDEFRRSKREEVGNKREDDYKSSEKKAEAWEIWSRTEGKVVWVTEGVDEVLDEQEPLFDVKSFFPCPKPAYATLEPGTLKPVPDFVYYKDQVDEINELTARISDLAESLRLKGFYAAGTSEIGEAIEAAMRQTDNKAILVPVSNFAAMGGQSLKDSIVWLPVTEVAQVIQSCIELRKQLIEDVYEITGLSDIMRGVTEAQETLGAQNLKAQYGSVRVREKQSEMVRLALDVLRIKAEIYAEKYQIGELLAMSGMQMPTQQQAQQIVAQAQAQQQPPPQIVTVEMVQQLLVNQRLRPFALEVETDSTIAPNEEAEKESRIEFLTAVGGFIQQAGPVIEARPEAAQFMGELLRFGVGAFRAGRDMGAAVDDFVKKLEQAGQGQDQPSPEAQAEMQKMQIEAQKAQADNQIKSQELALKEKELQLRAQEMQSKRAEAQQVAQTRQYDAQVNAAVKRYELSLKMQEMGLKVDQQQLEREKAEIQALLDMEELELEKEQKRAVALGDTT